jgi:hypothetical protein
MNTSAQSVSWPESIAFLGLVVFTMFIIGIAISAWLEIRKTRVVSGQEDAMRQLVSRYEKLAEGTLDAQQRTATDVADLRARTAAIEQILRTVE